MNKRELLDQIALELGTPRTVAAAHLTALLNTIKNAIAQGDYVAIADFGTFKLKEIKGRKRYDFHSGAMTDKPGKQSIKFVPGKNFSALVNRVD
jgi:DNA-binding protein HU-beta